MDEQWNETPFTLGATLTPPAATETSRDSDPSLDDRFEGSIRPGTARVGFRMSNSTDRSTFAYRAFVSYSHADKTWAEWLHKTLETYRVPSRLVGKDTAVGVIPRR